jgi:hypothetical protein
MNLLTDGAANNPILRFCLNVVEQHGESWPPAEDALAREFVGWLGSHAFVSRDGMKKLCDEKGVNLTFIPLPREIRGFNCSFGNKREIVICDTQTAPFDLHTLFHEFREMLEHDLRELGHPIIRQSDSLEVHAEHFAILCRMEAASREIPGFLQMAENVENKWMRYLSYALVIVFSTAYLLHCIFTPQMEEVLSEARRPRYVRT